MLDPYFIIPGPHKDKTMILQILRGAFVLLVVSVSLFYLLSNQFAAQFDFVQFVLALGIAFGVAIVVIAIDACTRHKRLSELSGIFLGLLAGLLAAYALSFVVDLFGLIYAPEVTADQPQIAQASTEYFDLDTFDRRSIDAAWKEYENQVAKAEAFSNMLEGIKVVIGLITCYLGISLVIQTKDDFRFVLPYVEFAKQIRGNRPTILDTSVIIDGRIIDVIDTRVIQGVLLVPKFVLNELQLVADSGDKLKRARGRRGLDILQKLQDSPVVEVHIEDRDAEGGNVDQKLIALAQDMGARVMTNDYNLNKIATLRGVDVINMNDLAKALRPVVLPGEAMTVKVVKQGEGPTQGVGYLEDGTMVVVEGGRNHIGQTVDIAVTSTLQTSAGRMIFGRYDGQADAAAPARSGDAPAPPSGDSAEPRQRATPRSAAARNPRRSH